MGWTVALEGLAAASTGYSAIAQYEAAQTRESALTEELQQQQSAAKQQQINRLKQVNNTLGQQELIGATQGYDLSSTSFNTVSMQTINDYAEDNDADMLSENFKEQAINQQIQNAGAQGTQAIIGGIFSGIQQGVDLYGDKLFGSKSSSGAGARMQGAQALDTNNSYGIDYDKYRSSLFPSSYNEDLEY